MNPEINDGGPAFPCETTELLPLGDGVYYQPQEVRHAGLSIRDYFASKAMQTLLREAEINVHDDWVSKRSYQVADAMLLERSKK